MGFFDFLKTSFVFFIILFLIFAGWPEVRADTSSTLRPISDGSNDSGDWKNTIGTACNSANCYTELDEASCDEDASYIQGDVYGENQTFNLDLSGVADDSTITQIDITVCYKSGAPGDDTNDFQTRRCVDGSCANSAINIATEGNYTETTQSHSGLSINKTDSSVLEAGVAITGNAGETVRISQISAVITYTLPDTTAPSDVTNLSLSNPSISAITVSWTAPGDDGNTGTAATYDLRYSTSNITEANWSSANQAIGEPSPSAAGSSESKTVSGLSANTTYYFALKTSDEVPNGSGISNVPSLATTDVPDTTAPAAVSNLSLSNPSGSAITVSWTAPGDDGNTGTAATYDLRYSTSDITEANWPSANQAIGEPSPSAAGSSESKRVSGLSSNTTYYFALKTSDEAPNESGISNVPSLATLSPGEGEEEEEEETPPSGGARIAFFSGRAYPGCKIEVLRKRAEMASFIPEPIEELTISDDGKFKIRLTGFIGTDFLFALRAEDKDGRKTGIISFDVKMGEFDELIAKDIFVPPTVGIDKKLARKGQEIKVEGYAASNGKIEIEIDNAVEGEAQSNGNGYWSFVVDTNDLNFGEHYIRARQINQSGRKSNFSSFQAFKVSILEVPKADFNNDNAVNIIDWSIFLYRWGSEEEDLKSKIDMDDNEKIDITDFSIFLKSIRI